MQEQEIKKWLNEIFGSAINHEETARIIDLIIENDYDFDDLKDMAIINNLLGREVELSHTSDMDRRFYSMLEEERTEKDNLRLWRSINPIFFRVAASVALFLLGWFGSGLLNNQEDGQVINQLSQDVAGLKETLILTMLEQNSPSERIQAVSMVGEMTGVDEKIITGLLSVLNNDQNDNVRLVALEALVVYADMPLVREGIVKAIKNQDSPLIQLRLSEIMIALEEKSSIPEFQKILNDINLDYSVRSKINETVEVLL